MKKATVSDMTKHDLATALFRHMRMERLDRISVKDLANENSIPRSTFYYHFDDIYDLASWALAEAAMKDFVDGIEEGGTLEAGWLRLFRRCRENPEICRSVLDSSCVWRVSDSFCARSMAIAVPVVQRFYPRRSISESDYREVLAFYGHAVFSTLTRWVRTGMEDSPEKLARLIQILVYRNLDDVMDALRRDRGIIVEPSDV